MPSPFGDFVFSNDVELVYHFRSYDYNHNNKHGYTSCLWTVPDITLGHLDKHNKYNFFSRKYRLHRETSEEHVHGYESYSQEDEEDLYRYETNSGRFAGKGQHIKIKM